MTTATVWRGLLVAGWLLVCATAVAQRVQFPTPVSDPEAVPAPAPAEPAPLATFDGTIQPPSPDWDPYATPGSAPPALLPQDPTFQFEGVGPTFNIGAMQKLIQQIRLDYVWMPGSGVDEFGINDIEASVTVAIPFLYNTETPLLISPGFAVHLWNGPKPDGADLPPSVFDAYLEAAWNPQATPWLGGELSFRIGVYSDFDKIQDDSVRFTGAGLAVLTFTPSIQVKAGIWYLDRNRVKLLPAGGIVWTPNPDVRFEILFPNPKFARRLSTIGNAEWWWYLRGEYGGGAWTVQRHVSGVAFQDQVDYNDLRAAAGIECIHLNGCTGLFEAGVAFEREIIFVSGITEREFNPNTTVFLRGGLTY